MFFKVIGLVVAVVLASTFLSNAQEGAARKPSTGGGCSYNHYEGVARIISINQRSFSSVTSQEEYEIKFLFYPAQEIKEPFAQTEGRQFLLLTRGNQYPTTTFLAKNGIEVGKVFDCTLDVIVRGACTPMIFEFPSLTD